MKSSSWFKGKEDVGILLLRIFTGSRLLYGVVDNMINWRNMMEFSYYLQSFGFPFPTINALLSVYIQFLAAISILFGYRFRIFSALMIFNFLIALIFVHIPLKDTVEEMTPALAILFVNLSFVFTGAGKFSLDWYFSEKSQVSVSLNGRFQRQKSPN